MRIRSNLYRKAKASTYLLIRQCGQTLIVIIIIFLVGHLSALALSVGFVLGILFISFSYIRENSREPELEDTPLTSTIIIDKPSNSTFQLMTGKQDNPIVNLGGVQNTGDLSNISDSMLLNQISGDATNAVNKLPSSLKPEQPGIKELLTNLQEAIEADTYLNTEDKADALEQIKVLAEALQNPDKSLVKKIARQAIKIWKATVASLPTAANLAVAVSKLLPMIAQKCGLE